MYFMENVNKPSHINKKKLNKLEKKHDMTCKENFDRLTPLIWDSAGSVGALFSLNKITLLMHFSSFPFLFLTKSYLTNILLFIFFHFINILSSIFFHFTNIKLNFFSFTNIKEKKRQRNVNKRLRNN